VEISRKNNILADHLLSVLQRPPSAAFYGTSIGPTSLNRVLRQQEYEKLRANNAYMMQRIVRSGSSYHFEASNPVEKASRNLYSVGGTPQNLDLLLNLTVRHAKPFSASRPSSAAAKAGPDQKVAFDSKPYTLFRNTVELLVKDTDKRVAARVIIRERLDRSFEIEVSGEKIMICQTSMSYSDLRSFFPSARQTSALVSGVLSCLSLVEPSQEQLDLGADANLLYPIFIPPLLESDQAAASYSAPQATSSDSQSNHARRSVSTSKAAFSEPQAGRPKSAAVSRDLEPSSLPASLQAAPTPTRTGEPEARTSVQDADPEYGDDNDYGQEDEQDPFAENESSKGARPFVPPLELGRAQPSQV
jgi:hypothetical protein